MVDQLALIDASGREFDIGPREALAELREVYAEKVAAGHLADLLSRVVCRVELLGGRAVTIKRRSDR